MNAKELRSFSRSRVFTTLKQRAADGAFDRGLWRDLAGLGLIGMIVDREYGGGGSDIADFAESVAILAGEGFDLGLTLSLLDHVMLGLDASRQGYWLAYGGKPGIAFIVDGLVAAMIERGIGETAQRRIFVDTPAATYSFIEADRRGHEHDPA